MVITISGSSVSIIGEPDIIFEGNNLVNTLVATTDMDAGWEYNVDIYMPTTNRYNSIIMTRNGENLSVDLTRQMLPTNGRYIFQFRGQNGDAVYHTEKFELWIKDSIDLNEAYDPMPAEFYQMENKMKEILKQTQEAASETLPPISADTSGQYLTNDGTEAKWADVETGLTQEAADARYLQLSGGEMAGNIDMAGNQVRGVLSIVANGATGNAGVQFASNGNFTNIVCGVSTSASFSANAVDFYNHNLDRVNSINMTSEATIEDANYIGGNVEENNRTAIDFTAENAVSIWAEGSQRVIMDTNGVNVNGNKITGVDSIVAEGSTVDNIKFESNGAIVGILCGGKRSATFTANGIDAYDHQINRVASPTNDTDAANKQYVDTQVQTIQESVTSIGDTVNDIIDGTEALPYLPDTYTPPIASSTQAGMVKQGAGITIGADGTISANNQGGITQSVADGRYLQLAGGTMSGAINMGGHALTNLPAPVNSTDAIRQQDLEVVSQEIDRILDGTTPVAIPAATETHVGGVIIGAGINVQADGTISNIVPAPTAEDNGKLLVVENGVYVLKTLAEIQGGGTT